jgi:hypothetical protein
MPGLPPGATVRTMHPPFDSALGSLAELAPTLMRVADALDWPLVLVDAQGRLQHANRPAVCLMAEGRTADWCWPGRPGGHVGQLRPLALDSSAEDAPHLLLDLRPPAVR